MVKLREVYSFAEGNWKQRLRVREVFINPEHVKYIRSNSDSILQEEKVPGAGPDFCTLLLDHKEIVVVGTLEEIKEKLFSGKRLLHD